MEAEEGAKWAEGDKGEKFYGYTYFVQGPYYSFSLVFMKKLKELSITNPWTAIKMATIHELGHQYAHLTDKYKEVNKKKHVLKGCCVMDKLEIENNEVIDCKNFCDSCVIHLKNKYWDYDANRPPQN
ncbi:MAG: hypothetical protein ABIN61_09020 [candidate division WOR-3 bacterium]